MHHIISITKLPDAGSVSCQLRAALSQYWLRSVRAAICSEWWKSHEQMLHTLPTPTASHQTITV